MPPRHTLNVTPIRITEPHGQKRLLPAHDRVVLERQQHHDDRRQPEQVCAEGEPEPEKDVAEIERVPYVRERSAVDQRTEALAAGARNGADVVNGPQSYGFASSDR